MSLEQFQFTLLDPFDRSGHEPYNVHRLCTIYKNIKHTQTIHRKLFDFQFSTEYPFNLYLFIDQTFLSSRTSELFVNQLKE